SLNYVRSGQYYLNKGGPYRDFFPEVLRISQGKFHVDYGYHLAPMDGTHIREIPDLVERHGVASFKIFMFYGSHGLHGRSDSQRDFLMIGPEDRYDYAHFEFVMRGVQAARERFPDKAQQISLSLHCETAEIMTAYTKMVETEGKLQGLAAYQAARPREDVEYLWQQVLAGKIDWVVSDHACCRHETKAAKNALGNIWLAKSGFGGTEYLLPALVSEGAKRGLSYQRIAELTSRNPAR